MTDAKLNNSDEEVRLEDLQPIYRRLAKVFGLNNALLFGREFGGQSLYFPKVDAAIAVKARATDGLPGMGKRPHLWRACEAV